MSNLIRQPYHLVDESPWPLLRSLRAFFLTVGIVKWFHFNSSSLLVLALLLLIIITAQWWRDVRVESTYQGLHSAIVELGIRYGIALFIVSEVLFFASFFWAFFHRSLAPTVELGGTWPPLGIIPFRFLGVPLLNTIVLLSSGLSVTWAHHAIITGDHQAAKNGLLLTIIMGGYFSFLQGLEYYEASFRMADGAYGSTFFIATGFHGLHVIVGSLFLLVCLVRILAGQFSLKHHFGLEAAAWYWHFVDVVWLFLYISIYWWGGQ